MTTRPAEPAVRYGAMESARTAASASVELHHKGGHDHLTCSRTPGLVLNVRRGGASWRYQFHVGRRVLKLRLGELDTWTLDQARALAAEARAMIRDGRGVPDAEWVRRKLRAHGKIVETPSAPTIFEMRRWTFGEARSRYLDEIARTRRPDTLRDYRGKLGHRELAGFERIPVARITVQEMARAVRRIPQHATASGVVRVVKAMWGWLARPEHVGDSAVTPGAMQTLRAPEQALVDVEGAPGGYVPTPDEIGVVLAACRSGGLWELTARPLALAVYTGQRRRTVATARGADFTPRRGDGTEGLWQIPVRYRKSGRTKPGTHVVPLPASAWSWVSGLDATDPVAPGELADGTRHVDTLSHDVARILTGLGVQATLHDFRRALATHGEREVGIPRGVTKVILNHAAEASDVTAVHYALHDRSHITWPALDAWCAWCDRQAEAAIEREPRLVDPEWVRAQVG